MHSTLRWILISLGLAAVGCTGTSVGNPPGAEVKLGAVGTITDKAPVSQNIASEKLAGGVTVSEAWVVLRDVGLRESGTCEAPGDAAEADVSGAFAADLLTGAIYPEAPEWQRLGDERYCAFDAPIGPASAKIEGAPEALEENGAYVRGARADGTPFEILVPIDEDLRLGPQGKGEFVLGHGPVGLLVTFNMNTWISPALLDKAEVKGGTIFADAGENADLTEGVRSNIAQSAQLLRDKDRDGKLSSEDGEL